MIMMMSINMVMNPFTDILPITEMYHFHLFQFVCFLFLSVYLYKFKLLLLRDAVRKSNPQK